MTTTTAKRRPSSSTGRQEIAPSSLRRRKRRTKTPAEVAPRQQTFVGAALGRDDAPRSVEDALTDDETFRTVFVKNERTAALQRFLRRRRTGTMSQRRISTRRATRRTTTPRRKGGYAAGRRPRVAVALNGEAGNGLLETAACRERDGARDAQVAGGIWERVSKSV